MATQLFHIILAFFVLLSTTGITLSEHICQSERQAIGVFAKAEGCHSERSPCQKDRSCCGKNADDCNGCCENSAQYYQLDQDQQIPSFGFKQLKSPVPPTAVPAIFQLSLPAFETLRFDYLLYKPPIVARDILVLLQVFLC